VEVQHVTVPAVVVHRHVNVVVEIGENHVIVPHDAQDHVIVPHDAQDHVKGVMIERSEGGEAVEIGNVRVAVTMIEKDREEADLRRENQNLEEVKIIKDRSRRNLWKLKKMVKMTTQLLTWSNNQKTITTTTNRLWLLLTTSLLYQSKNLLQWKSKLLR